MLDLARIEEEYASGAGVTPRNVRDLIIEVKRLKQERDEARDECERLQGGIKAVADELDAWHAPTTKFVNGVTLGLTLSGRVAHLALTVRKEADAFRSERNESRVEIERLKAENKALLSELRVEANRRAING